MADERLELEKSSGDESAMVRPGYPPTGYADASGYGYSYGYNEAEEGIRFREIWRIVRKRKWLIITVTLIVTTIVAIESYRTKSTYMASAFIELGKESPTVRSGTGNAVIQTEDSDVYFPQLSINTNLFRLTSEPLLEEVVINLKLDQNPNFIDTGRKTVPEAVQALGARLGLQKQQEPSPTVLPVVQSEPERDLPRTPEQSERLAPFVGLISGGLRAEQVRDTRTLKVTFTHTDPVIAAAVANGVAQDFIEQSFEGKTERFTSASKWLDTTTRELQAKVERAEQDLANYTREHNIFSTDGKETLITDKLSRLHDQATRAETDLILKQSVYEEVKAGRGAQLPVAFADPKISSLQTKLEELQASADKLSLKFGPENPMVAEVNQQIKTVKAQIEASRKALEDKLKGDYELALRDDHSLKAALQQAKNEAVQQNQDAIQYNILRQEVDTANSLYKDFLQKTSQAKVEVAQQHNNLRLVQPARVPRSPVGPKRFRMIMLGLFISLGAGACLACFLEYLDSTIKTIEDVGRYVRLPALGVIPTIATNAPGRINGRNGRRQIASNGTNNGSQDSPHSYGQLAVLDNRSSAAEAYRVVRTSMLLSAAGSPPRTILITSGQPGEGKTTTVVNTAISLAQLGASVLIIDCDLRKPATHKIFGIDHSRGLSTYLSRDTGIEGLIQKLQIPNLSLLPCGPIPPNPAELISSEKMRSLLKTMAGNYDHILIDSPPLINVTDSVILSSLVDGVILVIHGGKSTRAIAQRARQELTSVGAKIFGVVLNNIDMRREGYDEYYYARYYSGAQPNGSEANAP